MIFKTERDAKIYAECCGKWYAKQHRVIKATRNGVFVGYMLQLKTKGA